jgi:hypothetical protein
MSLCSLPIPCRRGRLTAEAYYVKERPSGQIITEEEVITQEKPWGIDLDIPYFRQLYRGFGWPHAFRREKTFDAVDKLMDKLPEHRDG